MYKLPLNNTYIIRLADLASIPKDPANSDYISYLSWVAKGNTPQLAETPEESMVREDKESDYNTLLQIKELEFGMLRTIREVVLGSATARTFLDIKDKQIAVLRSKLKGV